MNANFPQTFDRKQGQQIWLVYLNNPNQYKSGRKLQELLGTVLNCRSVVEIGILKYVQNVSQRLDMGASIKKYSRFQ